MIRFDLSHAPLVVIDYLKNIGDREVKEAIRSYNDHVALDADHALMTDLREQRLDCSMSELLAKVDQNLHERRRQLTENCRGVGVLVDEPEGRQVAEALLDAVPSRIPSEIFDEPWELIGWSASFFADDGGTRSRGEHAAEVEVDRGHLEVNRPSAPAGTSDPLSAPRLDPGDGQGLWTPYPTRYKEK